jgi:hypothetical protein
LLKLTRIPSERAKALTDLPENTEQLSKPCVLELAHATFSVLAESSTQLNHLRKRDLPRARQQHSLVQWRGMAYE